MRRSPWPFCRVLGRDARQQAAGRIAWCGIRVHRLHEPVSMVQDAHLDAVPLLAIDLRRLAAHVVGDARGRHEVAFIRGVQEHPGAIGFAAEHSDRCNAAAVFADALRAIEPLVAMDGESCARRRGLRTPVRRHGASKIHIVRSVPSIAAVPCPRLAIFGLLLPLPDAVLLVVSPDAMVELAGQTPDDFLAARVGPAEPAGRETAQVLLGTDQNHGLAHLGDLHRCDHAG